MSTLKIRKKSRMNAGGTGRDSWDTAQFYRTPKRNRGKRSWRREREKAEARRLADGLRREADEGLDWGLVYAIIHGGSPVTLENAKKAAKWLQKEQETLCQMRPKTLIMTATLR